MAKPSIGWRKSVTSNIAGDLPIAVAHGIGFIRKRGIDDARQHPCSPAPLRSGRGLPF
jgi:hypothetical protein